MSRILSLLLPAYIAFGASLAAQSSGTRSVADRYLALQLSRGYDALKVLYTEDARFADPTADVFGGGVGQTVSGADAIVEMQEGWGFDSIGFEPDASFAVGAYSLDRGTLRLRREGAERWTALPFVMVLRIEDGRVEERTDFARYVGSYSLADSFAETTEATRRVAEEYLEAYLTRDLQAQRRLLAPDARFQDPTAQVYGPGSGQALEGAEQILGRRAQTFQNVTAFDLKVESSFASNHHAVFMGSTTYTLGNGARYEQPAVFVVEVRDGRVTRHWDFVDYSVGPIG